MAVPPEEITRMRDQGAVDYIPSAPEQVYGPPRPIGVRPNIIATPATPQQIQAALREDDYVVPELRVPPPATLEGAIAAGEPPYRDVVQHVMPSQRAGGESYGSGPFSGISNLARGTVSGLSGAIASIPDYVVSAAILDAKSMGVLPMDTPVTRNIFDRIINASDYETIRTAPWAKSVRDFLDTNYVPQPTRFIAGQLSALGQRGEGDKVGFQTSMGRMGQGLGIGAAMGVGTTALTASLARRIFPALEQAAGPAASQAAQLQTLQRISQPFSQTNPLGTMFPGIRLATTTAYPARYMQDPMKLAAAEIGAGGIGGIWYQGWEEAIPGSGPWSLAVPMAGVALAQQGMGGVFNLFGALANKSPSGRATTWFSERASDLNTQTGREGILGTVYDTAARTGREAGDRLRFWNRGQRTRRSTEDKIEAELTRQENAAYLSRTEQIEALIENITGEQLQLSPAARSRSPILMREESRLVAGLDQESAAAYRETGLKNAAIMNDFVEQKLFMPVIDPETGLPMLNADGQPVWPEPSMIIDSVTGRVQRLNDKLTANLRNIDVELGEMAGGAQEVRRDEAGRTIRTLWQTFWDNSKAATDKLATDLGIDQRRSVGYLNEHQIPVTRETTDASGNIITEAVLNPDGTPEMQTIPAVRDQLLGLLNLGGTHSMDDLLGGRQTHKLIREFLDFNPESGTLGFQNWRRFRQQVTTAMRSAEGVDVTDLASLRTVLDNMMYGPAGHFRTATNNYKEFAWQYFENMILPFERAAVKRTIQTGPGSAPERVSPWGDTLSPVTQYTVPDEEVALAFLRNSDTADQFMHMAELLPNNAGTGGQTPQFQMLTAMRDVVLDRARNASGAMTNGKLDEGKLNQYISDNRPMLETLRVPHPVTGEQVTAASILSDTGNRLGFLLSRQRRLQARQRRVEDYSLTRALDDFKAFANTEGWSQTDRTIFQNESMENIFQYAINRALGVGGPKDSSVLRSLASVTRGKDSFPGAQEALNRKLFEEMIYKVERAGAVNKEEILTPGWRPTATSDLQSFATMLGQNEDAFVTVMGREHFDNLLVTLDGFERVFQLGMRQQIGRGLDRGGLIEAFGDVTGVTPQGWSARMINMLEGRVSPRTTSVWIASQAWRAGNTRAMDQMLQRAMIDPEFARTLTRSGNDAFSVTDEQAGHLRRLLWLQGIVDPSNIDRVEVDGQLYPPRQAPPETRVYRYPLPSAEPQPAVPPVDQAPATPTTVPELRVPQASTQPVPQASTQPVQNNMQNYSSLFPYDPLGQAVAEKETARDRSGIMSLLG